MASITEVSELDMGGEREVRRSLVNQELMMLYGHDVTGRKPGHGVKYLPPLPKNERPKSCKVAGGVWRNTNQAMRQLSATSRRGPRVTVFPSRTVTKKPPALSDEMKRPHTSFQNHITDVLNTKIHVDAFRPKSSHGKLESDQSTKYKRILPVENPEGLITPKTLPKPDVYTEEQLIAMEKLLSCMDNGLRKPKLKAGMAKRKRRSKKDTQKVDIDLEAKVGEYITRVLGGDIDNVPADMSTLVRLFVYSNRSDMEAERDALRTDAYMELRAYCQRQGLEFIVVDMCGPTMDSATTQYWMDEVNRCKSQSMGPFFVGLCGDYYGSYKPPLVIPADEYDTIYGVANRNHIEGNELLRDSYELDENAIPAVYRFKPGSLDDDGMARLPHLIDQYCSFAAQLGQIHQDKVKKYSVTSELDMFIKHGLINRKTSVRSKSLLFCRKFRFLDDDLDGPMTPQYTDIENSNGTAKMDDKKIRLKKELLEDVAEKVNDIDIKTFEIPWTGKGIDKNDPEHHEYLEHFVTDFVENVKRQIELNKNSWNIKNPLYNLYREARNHSELCENQHKVFSGRQDMIDRIRVHFTTPDEVNQTPLFITGEEGMGKSCLLAAVVKLFPHWLDKENATTVVRFVGTTLRSSRMRNILVDICNQVCHIYHMEEPHRLMCKTPDGIVRFFFNMLETVSKHFGEERPLLIAIDGIEKFGEIDRADTLFWIPQKMPKNIHLVLSMASEEVKQLNKLKNKYQEHSEKFIEVTPYSAEDVTRITQRVLDTNKKRISSVQSELLQGVCNPESHPLFIHHMLCEAVGWKSTDQVGRAVSLPTTLDDAVLSLLFGLEDQFGRSLIKHFVLYLSFFPEGLSEMEIRDLLLQTPCVLDDILKYSQYKADLNNVGTTLTMYLSKILMRLKHQTKKRSRYNKQLYTWNHPMYRDTCLYQYCKITDEEQVLRDYPAIMDMFTYHEGVNVKVTTEAEKWQLLATEVSPQYLHAASLHKLHLLPYLIANATPGEYLDKLKEMCLCNFQFLVSKLMGMGVEAAIKDIQKLVQVNDLELNLLKYFLKVCFDSLSVHPQNLASQLLGCVPYLDRDLYPHMSQMLDKVVEWLMESETPLLVPLLPCFQTVTEPCRSKLHNTIEVLTLDETGNLAVMKSKEGYIEVWDMVHEERAFFLGIKYDKTTRNIFVSMYRVLGIATSETAQVLKIWEIKSGRVMNVIDTGALFGTVSSLTVMCYTKEFEFVAFHMSDDDFNQRVVVVETARGEILYELNKFDVKDDFFGDSAAFIGEGSHFLFVNARTVDDGDDKTEDVISLNYHKLDTLEQLFSVQCGSKKFKKILVKDARTAIISWQDCSFDMYNLLTGVCTRSLTAPNDDLFCQACSITEDGFLVALATTGLDYALWFWEMDDQVSSELFSGTVSTKETDVPRDFIIIEDLHVAVLGTPESAVMMVWDLPASECIYKHQVHTAGLDRVVRTMDPYEVYTCSSVEKLVKLWDLYAVIETHKHSRSQPVLSFDDNDVTDLFLPDRQDEIPQFTPNSESPPLYSQPPLETLESVGSCASLNFSAASNEGILKRPGSSTTLKKKRPKSVRFRDQVSDEHGMEQSLEMVADGGMSLDDLLSADDAVSMSASMSGSMIGTDSGSLAGSASGLAGLTRPDSSASGASGSFSGSMGSMGSMGGSFSSLADGSMKSGSNPGAQMSAGSPDQSVLFSNRNEKTMKDQMEAMVEVSNIGFNSTEKQFVTGKLLGHPIVWDTFSGTPVIHLNPHSSRDVCVPWAEFVCGDRFIVGLTDNGEDGEPGWPKQYEYQVWEAATGIPVLYPEDTKPLLSPTAAISSDRDKIMLMQIDYCDPTGTDKADLLFKLFNIQEHSCIRQFSVLHPGVPAEIQISSDNLYCVTLSPKVGDSKVKTLGTLYLEHKKEVDPILKAYKFPIGKKPKNGATSHVIWQNGLGLLAGQYGDIQLWDMATGDYEENIYHDPTVKEKADPDLQNHNGKMVNHMIVSADCRYLFEGSKDGTAALWDLENEVMLHSYAGHSDEVCQVAMTEESDILLTAGKDNVLIMWHFGQMEKPICRLFIHVAATTLRITQDKKTVVAIGKPPNEPPKLIVLKVINV